MSKNYIVPTYEVLNGTTFKVYRSPNNKYIQKEGTDEVYSEAWDLTWVQNEYYETEKDLVKIEDEQRKNN